MSAPRPPETLVTARTLLRQVRPEDTDAIFEYASSPIATRYMVWSRATSRGASDQVERSTRSWADGSGFPWAATLRSSGELIGMIELRINLPKADFGYIFRERFWGQGLATEVVRCVVDWAYAQPEIFRVWATCHPDNLASIRVLEKACLLQEGRLENWEARPQLGLLAGPSLVFAKIRPLDTKDHLRTRV